jgi:hypothetical protein
VSATFPFAYLSIPLSSPTYFPILSTMCPSIQADLKEFLDLAKERGALPDAYPGARYLYGKLRGVESSTNPRSTRSSTPRRRTTTLTQKAKAAHAAKVAMKASRNDRRRRLPERHRVPYLDAPVEVPYLDASVEASCSEEAPFHDASAEASYSEDESSSSDIPLSGRHASTTLSSLTPLSTPTPVPEVRLSDCSRS